MSECVVLAFFIMAFLWMQHLRILITFLPYVDLDIETCPSIWCIQHMQTLNRHNNCQTWLNKQDKSRLYRDRQQPCAWPSSSQAKLQQKPYFLHTIWLTKHSVWLLIPIQAIWKQQTTTCSLWLHKWLLVAMATLVPETQRLP